MSVDPNLLQKFLTNYSPFIVKKAKALQTFSKNKAGTILLEPNVPDSVKLNPDQVADFSIAQNEILTDSIVYDDKVAKELFGDFIPRSDVQGKELTRDLQYGIGCNFIVEFQPNAFGIVNIPEAINKNLQFLDSKSLPSIFIKNITITNNSKDIYTSKLNYTVKLTVGFKDFGQLVNEEIAVTPLNDIAKLAFSGLGQKPTVKFMNLLYKNFNGLPTPGFQNSYDNNGLFLYLTFAPQSGLFPETKKAFEKITKTLHLTYKKHEFNIFKDNKALNYDFQHELIIEYISSDADISPKIGHTESIRKIDNNDLYSLIINKSTSVQDSSWVSSSTSGTIRVVQVFKQIEEHQRWINEFKRLIACIPPEKDISKLTFQIDGKPYTVAQMEEKIKEWKNKIVLLKNVIKLELAKTIEDELPSYTARVSQAFLNIYEQDNFSRDFEANGGRTELYKAGFTGAVAVAAGAALFFFPPIGIATAGAAALWAVTAQSLIIGGTIGALTSGFSAYSKAQEAKKTETDSLGLDETELIKIIHKNLEVIKNPSLGRFDLQATDLAARPNEKPEDAEKRLAEARSAAINQQSTGIDDLNTVKTSKLKDFKDIKFIFLGDLLSIISKINPNVRLIFGNKFFSVSNNQYGFTNYYYIPISAAVLRDFLIKYIVERQDFYYNTDIFVKDVFEVLLKNALKGASGKLVAEGKVFLPNKLLLSSVIHENNAISQDIFGKSSESKIYNPSNADNDFKKFKTDFIKSKNFSGAFITSDQFIKTISIFSMEDFNVKDFASAYESWALSPSNEVPSESITNVASVHFQRFINSKYLKPCIFLSLSGNADTILKGKNVSFTRIDNSNLAASNAVGGAPLFRLPYNISADLKLYLFFFLGIGSYIFVTPPQQSDGKASSTFGFGGLYLITKADFSYDFQKNTPAGITNPTLQNKFSIAGQHIGYLAPNLPSPAERERLAKLIAEQATNKAFCGDFLATEKPVEETVESNASYGAAL